jgi:hypothetical protein
MVNLSCEFILIGMTLALYMQGTEFELRSFHLFILKVEFIANILLDQKKIHGQSKIRWWFRDDFFFTMSLTSNILHIRKMIF